MKKLIIRSFYLLILLMGIFPGLVWFFFTTTTGLNTAFQITSIFLPGSLKVQGLHGKLQDEFQIDQLDYSNKNTQIKIKDLRLNWSLNWQQLILNPSKVKSLEITTNKIKKTVEDIQFSGIANPKEISLTSLNAKYLNQNISLQLQGIKKGSYSLRGQLKLEDLRPNGLHLNALIKGNMQDLTHGILIFVIPQTLYQMPKASKVPDLEFQGEIQLVLKDKQSHWQVKGLIGSANKPIEISGQGPLNGQVMGTINLQAQDFPLIHTQDYQITITPKLKFQLNPKFLEISGTVLVPNAQIKPHTLTNSLTLSDDVVYTNQNKSTPPLFDSSMNVQVTLGDHVELSVKGLHGFLEGQLHIQKSPQGPITANGELSVTKGEYKAFGQNLNVEQGQLIYTGGGLENPEINLRASKKIKAATATSGSNQILNLQNSNLSNVGTSMIAGVEVSGRLSAPKIELFSNPALFSQADILSMLLLGAPVNQAKGAEGQLLLAAVSSMNLGTGMNGAQLIEQLKQHFNFDLNVQTNTYYNQMTNQFTDTPAVVVGKSLSKKLYVSYNMGLSQANPNVLTLNYLLSQFFSLQASSSTSGSGLDLLYNRASKDK